MNCQNKRFIFRPANPEDGQEILEILEEDDFKGKISLVYTRRPDAYYSLMREAEEVIVVVCQDTSNNKIIGVGSCAIRNLYINGRTEKVGYLFGLRLRKDYRQTFFLIPRAYQALYAILKEKGIKLFLTTILEENLYAQKLLEKKRKSMPYYEPFGFYEVYALKTQSTVKNSEFKFRKADREDIPLIVEILNKQKTKMQFYPAINENDLLEGKFPGLTHEDFYILSDLINDIVAVGATWVQKSYKQYIVQGYGGILKYLYPLSFLFPLMGYPSLPTPGAMLNYFTLSFWAVKDNDPDIFKTFIQNISSLKEFPFFLVGVHQNNSLRDVLDKMPHISYKSKVYLVNWQRTDSVVESINPDMIPYLECGTL